MKDLFGNELTAKQIANVGSEKDLRLSEKAYKALIILYGKTEGQKCKHCTHFYFRVFSKSYPKCALSGCNGASRSSDWSSLWEACGKFEKEVIESK